MTMTVKASTLGRRIRAAEFQDFNIAEVLYTPNSNLGLHDHDFTYLSTAVLRSPSAERLIWHAVPAWWSCRAASCTTSAWAIWLHAPSPFLSDRLSLVKCRAANSNSENGAGFMAARWRDSCFAPTWNACSQMVLQNLD